MDEKEILLKAREAIKAGRYDQARGMLETIEHNPIAQKWIAKLDDREIDAALEQAAEESEWDRPWYYDPVVMLIFFLLLFPVWFILILAHPQISRLWKYSLIIVPPMLYMLWLAWSVYEANGYSFGG